LEEAIRSDAGELNLFQAGKKERTTLPKIEVMRVNYNWGITDYYLAKGK